MKLALVVLGIATLGICSSVYGGPFLPNAAHWIDYRLLSSMGPVADQQNVIGTTSLAGARTEVLNAPHKYPPSSLACSGSRFPTGTCWADVVDKGDVVYLAVLVFADCSTNAGDAVAAEGSTLFFVHWVGVALGFGQPRGCSLAESSYTLYGVSRADLPNGGILTVKLLVEDGIDGDSVASQTMVDLG